jgi:hypothetical protein
MRLINAVCPKKTLQQLTKRAGVPSVSEEAALRIRMAAVELVAEFVSSSLKVALVQKPPVGDGPHKVFLRPEHADKACRHLRVPEQIDTRGSTGFRCTYSKEQLRARKQAKGASGDAAAPGAEATSAADSEEEQKQEETQEMEESSEDDDEDDDDEEEQQKEH